MQFTVRASILATTVAVALAACGGGGAQDQSSTDPLAGGRWGKKVAVTVTPNTDALATGATKQFAATVSGTSNHSVVWTVREGASGGSVSAAGLYQAPSTAGTFHVVATSVTDATSAGTATVTVSLTVAVAVTVTVAVTPAAASLSTSGSQQFSATVSGTTNPAVAWTVQEGAAGGAVGSTGLYTAPSAAGTYHVVATSVVDPTRSAAAAVTVTAPATAGGSDAPVVLYTDLLSGPNAGGEANAGAYLSVFGKNFGSSGLGSTVRVYIGGAEVGRYLSLGPSRARPDVQQLTVQVGALGSPARGTPLPIDVVVNGSHSNTDRTFTVNPGDILFVDNVRGNDATAVVGDPTHPFRHVQTSDLSQGAWGKAGPGDLVVMRGTGTPWTDIGYGGYFMRFRDKSGSAPTGAAGSGPIVVMGYPGEDAYIRGTLAAGMTGGCISAINGQSYPGMGQWAVIANLRIDCEGYDGPISQEIYGDHWRIVNNDLSASTAPTSGTSVPRMGGIEGNGKDSVYLGNHIHDIQGSQDECHGIYITGDGSYEVAFNNIHDIRSGNGFQVYVNGTDGSPTASNVNLHHNWIHDVSKHGINVADGSQNGFRIYDNVVFRTQRAGIRFNTTILHGAEIFGNTFYATDTGGGSSYGAMTNDAALPADALDVEDNVFWPSAGTAYATGFGATVGTIAHNLWYGGAGSPTLDRAPILGNPGFVSPGTDFHLLTGGAAVGAGVWTAPVQALLTTDFEPVPRSAGAPLDVGAYARRP